METNILVALVWDAGGILIGNYRSIKIGVKWMETGELGKSMSRIIVFMWMHLRLLWLDAKMIT